MEAITKRCQALPVTHSLKLEELFIIITHCQTIKTIESSVFRQKGWHSRQA